MIEFFIVKVRDGFSLIADGEKIAVFASAGMAAEMAIRFAQDTQAHSYRIIY
ncbi:hypothetical protein [Ancylobacter pratisalsi]|uniref:Uncharacterized protein n=1 Tax=Ancylobacter pratisalsi TaxID=1745854 RepID=A0A6P1YJ08_9HYPH|nr:hypothetical protein [Ancylobacter pratisalsi]QIB32651.1 hypothetical protein G3A50_02235 [Ancylobacter pratisalsi]